MSRQNLDQYFGENLNFIKGDEKILIYWMAGASCSVTIVIAYSMWNKKWRYEQTLFCSRKKAYLWV